VPRRSNAKMDFIELEDVAHSSHTMNSQFARIRGQNRPFCARGTDPGKSASTPLHQEH
jgi:hypothetical protein